MSVSAMKTPPGDDIVEDTAAEGAADTDDDDGGGGTTNAAFTYEVTGDDGQTHTLTFKSLTKLPAGILRRHRHQPEEQLWAPFEWALSPEDLEILDEVPSDELPKILEAWQKHNGVELGESKGSSSSAVVAVNAKRSKRT